MMSETRYCQQCSGAKMVQTSFGPKPCPGCGGKGYLNVNAGNGSDYASDKKKRYPVTTFFVLTGVIVFLSGNETLYGIYVLVGLVYFIIKHG